jgi:hypothetical protein
MKYKFYKNSKLLHQFRKMSRPIEYLFFYVFGSSQILKKSAVFGSEDDIYKNFQLYIQKRFNVETYPRHINFMKAHLGYYPDRNGDVCTFVLIRCYSNTNYFLEKRKSESPVESFFLRYEKQVTLDNYSILQRRFRNKTYLDFSELEKEGLFYFFQIQHPPILNEVEKIETSKPSYPMIELIEKEEESPKNEGSKSVVVKDAQHCGSANQKSKQKMSQHAEKFGLDYFDKWQKLFIESIYDIFNSQTINKFNIDWVIASDNSTWIKVLQIVKYLSYDDTLSNEDWIIIKDPESYEKIATIIILDGVTSFKNIIFLFTKEPCPEFHSFIQEISNGVVFLENEPVFFQNPYILIFSKFSPIVYAPEIKRVYDSIKQIKEDGTFENTTFKIEELI